MKRIAVLAVVYPEVEQYFGAFLRSIEEQTYTDFELVLVNDGFRKLGKYLTNNTIKTTVLPFQGTWAEIRVRGIQWLDNNKFDYIIFADADDYSALNRIETVINLLEDYDMVCCDSYLFGDTEDMYVPFISTRFKDGDLITIKSIHDKNILGSNVGARIDAIIPVLADMPADIIAFDWLLFSLSLLRGSTCIFTEKTCCYYRQHSNNIASPWNVTNQQIIRGVNVKKKHYAALIGKSTQYKQLSDCFTFLSEKMKDNHFTELYCEAVRKNIPQNPLWWEIIKTEEELGL